MSIEQLIELHAVVMIVAVLARTLADAIADDHALERDVGAGRENVAGDVRDEAAPVGLSCRKIKIKFPDTERRQGTPPSR